MSGRSPGRAGTGGTERWARVTAMSGDPFAGRGLEPLSRMDRVGVAAPPRAGGGGGDARLRAPFGEDEELWGITGLLHDLDYERYPDLEHRPPAPALAELEGAAIRPRSCARLLHTPISSGVSRDTPMEKTLYAVDELSGFIAAVAYVRPEGIHGMTPKSVSKKLKQPSFAAASTATSVRQAPRSWRRLRGAPRVRDRRDRGAGGRARARGIARARLGPAPRARRRAPGPPAPAAAALGRLHQAGSRRRRRSGARRDGARAARGGRRALPAMRAASECRRRARGLRHPPGLPVRALDDPRHDVLEAAERGHPLAPGSAAR